MIEPKNPNVNAALCYVLWNHQGDSSTIGQQIRPLLGLGQHDRMTEDQVRAAKMQRDAIAAIADSDALHRAELAAYELTVNNLRAELAQARTN